MSIKRILIGKSLDPFDPKAYQHIALMAFFAWIGLGADGLSSSCYGPEQAFLALGVNEHLAFFVAIATAITVFIISLSYNQVVELFPSGGGGYKVATQLLGGYAGLISGVALLIDYVLTITISIASGVDALFSLLPVNFLAIKLVIEAALILVLTLLNLRGMKESIKVLLPIFLGFVITHFLLITYGIIAHESGFPKLIHTAVQETHSLAGMVGWFGVIALMLHSYSMGGSTYTGLEAVSNNVNRLKEPKVYNAKITMLYMAISLSITAAGILLLYLLWNVAPENGQTLNAIVFREILGHNTFGHISLIIVLALEAGILLVGANTGFLGGPMVLANMALDRWVPNRFRHLSSRLVTQNGILLFGIAALFILLLSEGEVSWLVVLYSLNVFTTFTITLLGLCVYWWQNRKSILNWWKKLLLSTLGFFITASILLITLCTKFTEGGWVSLVISGLVIIGCIMTKRHYLNVSTKLSDLNSLLAPALSNRTVPAKPLDPEKPTAVFFIGNERSVGMHTLLWVMRMFPNHFHNFLFLSVGPVDIESFSGQENLQHMQKEVDRNLSYFVDYCHLHDMAAKAYTAFGTDVIDQLLTLVNQVGTEFTNCIFFASVLNFEQDMWTTRILHNETPYTLQRRLHAMGKQLVILPMKI